MLKKILIILHKYKLVTYLSFQTIKIQLYKLYKPDLLARIFTKSNISKVLIIFTFGLMSRIFIGFYYDVNVFLEYYRTISLTYYWLMALFVVILGEIFTYFNLNILPSFIFDYYASTYSILSRIFSNIGQINKKVYKCISGNINIGDFSIKSITYYLSRVTNLFSKNKFTLGSLDEDLSDSYKNNKPFKTSNVLNKGEENFLLPKAIYKPGGASSTSYGESSNSTNRPDRFLFTTDAVSNKSKTSFGSSDKEIVIGIQTDDRNIVEANKRLSGIRNELRSSSIYTDEQLRQRPRSIIYPGYQDGLLYEDSLEGNFNTPSTMSPMFGGSQHANSRASSVRSNVVQGSISDYPAPLRIQGNHVNSVLSRNSRVPTPSSNAFSAFGMNNASLNSQGTASLGNNPYPLSGNTPYPLSGNRVLPNVPFSEVGNSRSAIPLDRISYNKRLPLTPVNYESNLDNIADSPRLDDPCSIHYQSKHRPQYTNERVREDINYYNPDIIPLNQEIDIKKPGLRGKVKLGFKTLGNKFSNGISKIESAYVHYETVSKRHIIWTLFEENSGQYENYVDFKKDWDSNTSLWAEIKDRTKKDLKAEIEGLLGIKGNKPTIGTSMNREIEDLLRTRRPFDRSANTSNNSARPRVINVQEESSTSRNRNRGEGHREHSRNHSHRHGHHRTHSRSASKGHK